MLSASSHNVSAHTSARRSCRRGTSGGHRMAKALSTWSMSARVRRAVALTVALTFLLLQTTAWAICSDGNSFPQGGYVIGQAPVQTAANWSPNVFTGTAGSVFVPDNSVNEHNDPSQPLTGGGHNWVFDQGSTLCKETDTGPAGEL